MSHEVLSSFKGAKNESGERLMIVESHSRLSNTYCGYFLLVFIFIFISAQSTEIIFLMITNLLTIIVMFYSPATEYTITDHSRMEL